MSTNPVTYSSSQHHFTFRENGDEVVAEVTDLNKTLTPAFFQVNLPDLSPSQKKLPQMEVISQMLKNNYYPLVSNGSITICFSSPGDTKSAASSADTYIPRDWSKPVKQTLTFVGHTSDVNCLIQLNDRILASGSEDHTIKLWELSGKCIKTCVGHKDEVKCLIELSDGTLASGSSDHTIKLWKRSGKLLKTLKGHTFIVKCLTQLKDGTLASGSLDYSIKIWDRNGKCLQTLEGHKAEVIALTQLSDGTLATGSSDSTIKLWDISGKCLQTFEGHPAPVYTLIQLKDGTLASGSEDKTVKLWNLSGKCLQTFVGHRGAVVTLTQLRNGTLASGSEDHTIKLWDLRGKCLQTLKGHTLAVTALIQLSKGTLASGSWDKSIKLWEGEPLASRADSLQSPRTQALPAELQREIDSTQTLLQRYNLGPQSDPAYTTKIQKWLSSTTEYYKKNPQDPAATTTIAELQRIQKEIRAVLHKTATTTKSTSTPATMETQFQRQLAELVGASEAAIKEIHAKYEAQGKAFFEQMLYKQEAALQAALEKNKSSLSAELSSAQKELYHDALQKALRGTDLNTLAAPQLQMLQSQLSQSIGPQLQLEIQTLMQSRDYQGQMQLLQRTILDEITQRQSQLIQEVIHTQNEQIGIKDKQSVLYKAYETKQKRLQEQQHLQSPPAVLAFYNATEKHLSAKLMSAMMLVSGFIAREETKLEKGVNIGSKVAEILCGAIPVVGQVVGSIVSFGIEKGAGLAADRSEEQKQNNAFDSALSFKDAMALAELAARRTTQAFREHIQTLTPDKGTDAGEKAADAMYTYLQKGHLKAIAHKPMEEKITALVKAVEEASKTEKGFLSKRGGVFEKPVQPSPAFNHHFKEVKQDVHGLGEKVDLLEKHAHIASALIKSIATEKEQTKAVASLSIKETFVGHTFQVARTKKDLIIPFSDQGTLKRIAIHLTATFDTQVVDDCDIEECTLTITARSAIHAQDLETILKQWLRIQ